MILVAKSFEKSEHNYIQKSTIGTEILRTANILKNQTYGHGGTSL